MRAFFNQGIKSFPAGLRNSITNCRAIPYVNLFWQWSASVKVEQSRAILH